MSVEEQRRREHNALCSSGPEPRSFSFARKIDSVGWLSVFHAGCRRQKHTFSSLSLGLVSLVQRLPTHRRATFFYDYDLYLFVFKRNTNKQILAASKLMPQAAASGCMNLREGGD